MADATIDLQNCLIKVFQESNNLNCMHYYFKIEDTDFEFPAWRPLYLIGKEGKFQITSGDKEIDPHTFKTYKISENTTKLVICVSSIVDITQETEKPIIIEDKLKAKMESMTDCKIPIHFTDSENGLILASVTEIREWKLSVRRALPSVNSKIRLLNESTGDFYYNIYLSSTEAANKKHDKDYYDDDENNWNCVYSSDDHEKPILISPWIRLFETAEPGMTVLELLSVNPNNEKLAYSAQAFKDSFFYNLTAPGKGTLESVKQQILKNNKDYSKKNSLAPISSLIQCSGSGKSKVSETFTSEGLGFYVCLRKKNQSSTGYPLLNNLSIELMKIYEDPLLWDSGLDLTDCKLGTSLVRATLLFIGKCIVSYLRFIATHMRSNSGDGALLNNLLKDALASASKIFESSANFDLINDEMYSRILAATANDAITVKDSSVGQIASLIQKVLDAPIKCFTYTEDVSSFEEICSFLAEELKRFPFVFVVDEIGLLGEMPKTIKRKSSVIPCNGYQCFRRALSYITNSSKIYFLGLGTKTSAKVVTEVIEEQSLRMSKTRTIYPPIVFLGNMDIWRDEFPLHELPVTFKLLRHPNMFKFFCSLAYPIFSSTPFDEAVVFGITKIVNGALVGSTEFYNSVWMIRTGLNGRFKSQLASSLVTNRMATLLSHSDDLSEYLITYPACPILALSCRLLCQDEKLEKPISQLFMELRKRVDSVEVDKGQLAEYIAGMVLMLCIDYSDNIAEVELNTDLLSKPTQAVAAASATQPSQSTRVDSDPFDGLFEFSTNEVINLKSSKQSHAMKVERSQSSAHLFGPQNIEGPDYSQQSVKSSSEPPVTTKGPFKKTKISAEAPKTETIPPEAPRFNREMRRKFDRLWRKKAYLLESEESKVASVNDFRYHHATTVENFLKLTCSREAYEKYKRTLPVTLLKALINASYLVPLESVAKNNSATLTKDEKLMESMRRTPPGPNAFVKSFLRNVMGRTLLKTGLARGCGFIMPKNYFAFDIALPICFRECDSLGQPIYSYIAIQVKSGKITPWEEFSGLDMRLHYCQCTHPELHKDSSSRCEHCEPEDALQFIFKNQLSIVMELKDLPPLMRPNSFTPESLFTAHESMLKDVKDQSDDEKLMNLINQMYGDPQVIQELIQNNPELEKVHRGNIIFPAPIASHYWKAFRDVKFARFLWDDTILKDSSVVKRKVSDSPAASTKGVSEKGPSQNQPSQPKAAESASKNVKQKQAKSAPKKPTTEEVPINLPEYMKQSTLNVLIINGWDQYLRLPEQSEDIKEAFELAKDMVDNAAKVDVPTLRLNNNGTFNDFLNGLLQTCTPRFFEFDPYRREEFKPFEIESESETKTGKRRREADDDPTDEKSSVI